MSTTTEAEPVPAAGAARGLEQRVLVSAPFGRDAPLICDGLREAGFDALSCPRVDGLCAEIRRGAAAALIVEEALSGEARRQVSLALADQPAWSDLPLLVMTSRSRKNRDGWHALRGIEGTAHLTLLERPLFTATLVSAVRAAVESRRRQYQVREELAARQRTEEAVRELNETLEAQVAERTAEAERRAQHLRRLTAELTHAEHRERQRLAKILHDGLQQLLVAAKFRLPDVERSDKQTMRNDVEALEAMLDECLNASRSLAVELSPPILQRGTLEDMLRWICGWFQDKYDLTVDVRAEHPLAPVAEHIRLFFFEAVRELLLNAVKHSGATHARIALRARQGFLAVQVEDSGKAFDPGSVEDTLANPRSFGLFSIRERLESLDGRLEFERTPAGGACFRLLIPSVATADTATG